MPVIIEEEKKPINWTTVIVTAVILIVLFVGGYYLFFQKPELIEVVAPRELQTITNISQVQFDPTGVVNSATFKLLRQYGTPVVPPAAGRDNPFEPF